MHGVIGKARGAKHTCPARGAGTGAGTYPRGWHIPEGLAHDCAAPQGMITPL